MTDEVDDVTAHASCVEAWLARVQPEPERLVPAFERAFAALWSSAYQTLGEVTLTAMVDGKRVASGRMEIVSRGPG